LAIDDKMLLRLSIADPRKTSNNLKRNMVDYRVHLNYSSSEKRLVEARRIDKRPKTKQLLHTNNKK